TLLCFICFLLRLCLPCSSFFPYTTLFRSRLFSFLFDLLVNDRLDFLNRICTAPRLNLRPLPVRLLPHHKTQYCWQCEPIQLHHRSEEHTSELQSRENIVCRLLLEKKNINT